jgi:hypothetical protein
MYEREKWVLELMVTKIESAWKESDKENNLS